jgi:hypothetical protein
VGLKSPVASVTAKRIAAMVLEVLAGTRTPTEAAASLELSLPRYYQLEGRAFQGLVAACEPLPQGRQSNPDRQVLSLRRELERLKRDHVRQQTLVRVTQRTLGLSAPEKRDKPGKVQPNGKTKRVRRPTARALKAVRSLRSDLPEAPAGPTGPDVPAAGASQQGAPSAGSPELLANRAGSEFFNGATP